MDKADAIIEFMNTRYKKVSNTGIQRVMKAAKVLGLSHDELMVLLRSVEICNKDGDPYNPTIKRVW